MHVVKSFAANKLSKVVVLYLTFKDFFEFPVFLAVDSYILGCQLLLLRYLSVGLVCL